MVKRAIAGGLAAAVCLFQAGQANAAQVLKTITISGTVSDGSTGPTNPFVTFSLNLDNSANFSNSTSRATLILTNLFTPIKIGYAANSDILSIVGGPGNAAPGSCSFTAGTFCSFLFNVSGATQTSNILVYQGLTGPSRTATNVSVQVAAVPVSATWAMLLLGFGLIGFAMRKRGNVRTTVRYA